MSACDYILTQIIDVRAWEKISSDNCLFYCKQLKGKLVGGLGGYFGVPN